MDRYLEEVVAEAKKVRRPPPQQCAVEKYTQMPASELNAYVAQFVADAHACFGFYPAEHSDWIHSESVTQERYGPRLLDVFFLKYPAIHVPEKFELVHEYEWYKSCDPELYANIDIDGYTEELAKIIFRSLEVYREALQQWFILGKPCDLDDCLRGANLEKLKEYEGVQLKRSRATDQSYARHYNAGAPPHVLERIQALAFREQMALHLIQESIERLQ